MNAISIILIIVVSYLLGSVPTAYFIGRLRGINIFEVGSGNMGGTNAARAMGIQWGVLVVVLDVLKGVAAVLIAHEIMVAHEIMADHTYAAGIIAAIAVVIGHSWSLIATLLTMSINKTGKLTIKGGKGAATALGTLIMIAPAYIIVASLTLAALIIAFTRFVSLGVLAALLIAAAGMVILSILQPDNGAGIYYALIVAAVMLWRFRGNIQRLLTGTERRLGERA